MLIHKLLICLGLVSFGLGSWPRAFLDLHSTPVPPSQQTTEQVAIAHRLRVNAPYNVPGHEAAVFWFGQVTPDDNYADMRIGYRDEYLFVHVNIMDRRLWYDVTPSPGELTDWDAVSLYLDVTSDSEASSFAGSRYRFDAQLVWWEDRSQYQAAYRSGASGWSLIDTPFTTESSWSGDVPNTDVDDRGWSLLYYLPFTSLGLSVAPPQETMWSIALVLHDRDSVAGPVVSTQVWPPAMSSADPSTWAELFFGMPLPYIPLPAVSGGALTIRHGLDDAVVVDADVGGSSVCGAAAAPDYFPIWGKLNYAGKMFLNVQNLGHISEWPCFSKYYVTFPLDALPPGRVILSAYLTLYQFGNAGEGETPGPKPSLIQVSVIDQAWDEASITWNNAPLPVENVTAAWVDPLETSPPWPGIPREWDVSGAVAAAYASGHPVRLVLYSPDWDFHSGKYFYSSDIGGGGEGRPTLSVLWGNPAPDLAKSASPTSGVFDDTITYTLCIRGDGQPLTLTDVLPSGLGVATVLEWIGTPNPPIYDSGQHLLTWSDSPTMGQAVTLTYSAQIEIQVPAALVNTAELQGSEGFAREASATVLANPLRVYLPVVLKTR